MSLDLTGFSPTLRQAILNRLSKIEPEDVEEYTEQEIVNIAEQVIEDEEGSNGSKKINMNRILKAMELGLSLNSDKFSSFGTKGISDAEYVYPLNTDFLYQLLKMGIIAMDENNHLIKDADGLPKIIDTDAASSMVGKPVSTFMELFKAVGANSYSYEEDISRLISEDFLNELIENGWILGPLEEYATEKDFDNENVTGRRYALNIGKIEQDFSKYLAAGNKIETIEDLVKALDWATDNNHQANGEIDEDVFQGGTGDCWLLSAILALNATEAGKQVLHDSMKTNPDGSITVTFNGINTANGAPVQYTITADEIQKHDTDYNSYDSYSNGDNDMLIMELAVEKLEKDIYDQSHYQKNSLGKEILLPNIPEIADTQPGEDIYDENGDIIGRDYLQGGFSERLLYFLTGNGSQVITPEGYDEVVDKIFEEGNGSYIDPLLGASDGVALSGLSQEQINQLFEAMSDSPKALTFGIYPDPDTLDKYPDGRYKVYDLGDGELCLVTTREFTDINGKKFTLQLPFTHVVFNDNGTPKLDANGNIQYTKANARDAYIGHALVITGVDTEKRTVTIANPHDSGDEYTFTWEQFQQMGILSITATDLDKPQEKSSEGIIDDTLVKPQNKEVESFDDIINAIPEENKILTDDIVELLKQAQNGDINALLDLSLYGFEIGDSVAKSNGSFDVKVTLNGVSYTFNYSADKKDMLIFSGLLKADSAGGTRYDDNSYKFASLEEAIEKMELRSTNCKGVYCEQHNQNKAAGDYTEQRHYVWNEATHEMIELKDVFYISPDGRQAKGLEGYEEVLAYQQGYKFTGKDGIYEKNGKQYQFDKKTFEFVEIQKSETRSKNINNSKSSETPEIVKYLNSPEFSSYMRGLSSWCTQNNYTMSVLGLDGDEFIIKLYNKNDNKYGGQIVIDNDGSVQFDTNNSETRVNTPPLPKFPVK